MSLKPLVWTDHDRSVAKCPVTGTLFFIMRQGGLYWPSWDHEQKPLRDLDAMKAAAEAFRRALIAPHLEETFQQRTRDWAALCVGEKNLADITQRGDRLLEEVLEALQATGYDQNRVAVIMDHVFAKEPGDIAHETGDVIVGISAWCSAHGIDMAAAGEAALARNIANTDRIRERQARKPFASETSPEP